MIISKYRVKPRFFLVLGLSIILAGLFVKAVKPDSLFTSNYWRGHDDVKQTETAN